MLNFIKKNKNFAFSILLLFAFRWSLADQYRVPSESMFPNLHIGDHIGVNKAAYDLKIPFTEIRLAKISEPQRGDIVVFIWPGDQKTNFVKRLVGVPGDFIEIENGFITVNGQALERVDLISNDPIEYTESNGRVSYQILRHPTQAKHETLRFIVPEGSYFFMGDNRDNSLDSRVWGFAKRESLKGKAQIVLWNFKMEKIFPQFDLSRFVKVLI